EPGPRLQRRRHGGRRAHERRRARGLLSAKRHFVEHSDTDSAPIYPGTPLILPVAPILAVLEGGRKATAQRKGGTASASPPRRSAARARPGARPREPRCDTRPPTGTSPIGACPSSARATWP